MNSFESVQRQDFSFFGKNNHLVGDFKLCGEVRIASHIQGTLRMQDNGSVAIESTGKFTGDIYCYDLEIFGEFVGEIHSKGKVILRPACQVSGKISAETLTVFPGAEANIEGHTL